METKKSVIEFDTPFSIFSIENDDLKSESVLYAYGTPGVGVLEIYASELGSYLESLSCPYSNDIAEMNMHFEEPEELNLEKSKYAHFYPPDGRENKDCGPFQIVFTQQEMDIVFSPKRDCTEYYKNDRVEFYFDDNQDLLYIRVRNLTPEEYNYLCSQKKNSDEVGQHTR